MRRLKHTVARLQGCLGYLPPSQSRLLRLRGGLAGGRQLSLRGAAGVLGISVVKARRLESSALHGLHSKASTGACGGAGTVVAGAISGAVARPAASPLATSAFGTAAPAPSPSAKREAPKTENDALPVDHHGVLGAFERGSGDEGVAGERAVDLLLFLFAVTALLFGAAAGTRQLAAAAPRRRPGGRPVLFLDVDGVIAVDGPTDETLPPFLLGPSLVYIRNGTGARLRRLAQGFELVWATGWEKHANDELPLILGIPGDLPVLSFGKRATYGSSEWKLPEMDRYARNRPVAWLDDHMGQPQEAWAEKRTAPTLLVETDASEGLTDEHVERLLAWADAVSETDEARIRAPARPVAHPGHSPQRPG